MLARQLVSRLSRTHISYQIRVFSTAKGQNTAQASDRRELKVLKDISVRSAQKGYNTPLKSKQKVFQVAVQEHIPRDPKYKPPNFDPLVRLLKDQLESLQRLLLAGSVVSAEMLFMNIKEEAPLLVWNDMFSLFAKHEMLSKFEEYQRHMSKIGLRPDKTTFAIMINAYANVGDVDKMEATLQEMKSENLSPHPEVHVSLLSGFAKSGKTEQLLELFDSIRADGISRNLAMYTPVVKHLIDIGDEDRVMSYFRESSEEIMPVSVAPLYPLLVEVLEKKFGGDVEKIFTFLKQNSLLTEESCHAVTGSQGVNHGIPQARACLSLMKHYRIPCSSAAYLQIICAVPNGEQETILSVLREVLGANVAVDSQFLSQTISAFLVSMPTYNKIALFLGKLEALGLMLDRECYQVLLEYLKLRDKMGVENLFNRLVASGIKPNIPMYHTVMSTYSRVGMYRQIIVHMNDMRHKFNLTPDKYVYTTLMSALCRATEYDAALKVYDVFKALAIKPDLTTYGIIINCCSFGKMMTRTDYYFDEMTQVYHIHPTSSMWAALMTGWITSDDPQRVQYSIECYNRMKDQHQFATLPTNNLCVQFLRACMELKENLYSPAVAVRVEILSKNIVDLYSKAEVPLRIEDTEEFEDILYEMGTYWNNRKPNKKPRGPKKVQI